MTLTEVCQALADHYPDDSHHHRCPTCGEPLRCHKQHPPSTPTLCPDCDHDKEGQQ